MANKNSKKDNKLEPLNNLEENKILEDKENEKVVNTVDEDKKFLEGENSDFEGEENEKVVNVVEEDRNPSEEENNDFEGIVNQNKENDSVTVIFKEPVKYGENIINVGESLVIKFDEAIKLEELELVQIVR